MDNQIHLKPIVRRKNPSFSSSLLDEIYRSFDDQTTSAATEEHHHKTEDQPTKKSANAEFHFPQSSGLNSCSSSSDSSFWTSSESETSKSFCQSKLAVRTSFSTHYHQQQEEDDRLYVSERKLKNECGGFVKAKSKALKMYEDLKKSKANQPVSPGSRLSCFLSTLFSTSTGNAKKAKFDERKYTSVTSSTCSSASLFTRSCFSKTTSSRGKLNDGVKRSVRFYPVISVIMDKDRKHKDNGRHKYDNFPARNSICGEEIRENNRRAREVLKKYEKKLEECKMMNDDEDCESCASSDLFELDNLDSVTISRQRYSEELPVFETTSVDANRAIAYGLLM